MENVFGLKKVRTMISERNLSGEVVCESTGRARYQNDTDLLDTIKIKPLTFKVKYNEDMSERILYPQEDGATNYSHCIQKLNSNGDVIKSIYMNCDEVLKTVDSDYNVTEVYNINNNELVKTITTTHNCKTITVTRNDKYSVSIIQKENNNLIQLDLAITIKLDNNGYIKFNRNTTEVYLEIYDEVNNVTKSYNLEFNTIKLIKYLIDNQPIAMPDINLSKVKSYIKACIKFNDVYDSYSISQFDKVVTCSNVYSLNTNELKTVTINTNNNSKSIYIYDKDININKCMIELNSQNIIFISLLGIVIYNQPNKCMYKLPIKELKVKIKMICKEIIDNIELC